MIQEIKILIQKKYVTTLFNTSVFPAKYSFLPKRQARSDGLSHLPCVGWQYADGLETVLPVRGRDHLAGSY
jgi:hypothetical protein